ncbi:MAG: hypothetical protein NVS3B21_16620 [Acidimicrobiales bacterium]
MVTGVTFTVRPAGANFCQNNIEDAWFLAYTQVLTSTLRPPASCAGPLARVVLGEALPAAALDEDEDEEEDDEHAPRPPTAAAAARPSKPRRVIMRSSRRDTTFTPGLGDEPGTVAARDLIHLKVSHRRTPGYTRGVVVTKEWSC